ncbi:MAG: HlyD family efflux transporter periplasmic adaptor subunit, partial [Lachnospiraceae bacterium]|nr:HlyD family efflux transporter periplasmic adaptor subunit [Lachnospiraceae bacterium]
ELDLSSQSSAIREQQEEVERLREKSVGSTIVAPVAGTVNSISKTAGETTVPDEAIAVMQPEGKGYSMSFSVTNEQAQKVSVGEKAELQNAWYYDDVTATLTNIRPDTQNPGQKKLLYFSVTGSVQPGQSISLSIGQRSANYDLVVPNSAIREDSNGKFILIVESKNSPLGNRYVATRVDVEVLTSDDLNTAISAALYGYEYVITTANKPVEAGKQIRLADE